MTVEGWLIFAITSFVIMFLCCCISLLITEDMTPKKGFLFAIPIILIILFAMLWLYGSAESGKQAYKTQTSNLNSGIERTIEVYDATGNLIKQYYCKAVIEHEYNRITFEDVNGKRHIIFYPTGIIIIDEKE